MHYCVESLDIVILKGLDSGTHKSDSVDVASIDWLVGEVHTLIILPTDALMPHYLSLCPNLEPL